MLFNELKKGHSVIVQAIWGDSVQDASTKVSDTQGTSLILHTFSYKGLELEVSSKNMPGMVFDLIYTDPDSGEKTVWEDVTVIPATGSDGKNYYAVQLKSAGEKEKNSERRSEMRIPLDIPGIIPGPSPSESVPVTIHDISRSGVSILAPSSYTLTDRKIQAAFSDIVNADAFIIPMECRVLRSVPQPNDILKAGGTVLYGCRIEKAGPALVTYLLTKASSK